jgi:hypothetical protein
MMDNMCKALKFKDSEEIDFDKLTLNYCNPKEVNKKRQFKIHYKATFCAKLKKLA